MQMNKRTAFIFLLAFLGVFILKFHSFGRTETLSRPIAHKCELKTSDNHNNRSKLLNDMNASVQVLNYRTVKTLHFVKALLFILGGLVVCHTCLKHCLHISNS